MAVANFYKFWLLVFGLFETFSWFDDLSLFFLDFTTFNLAKCWIFAVFLDVTWLVAVYAKFGDSAVIDSNFSTNHGQKLWNFLFNCHLCRQISSAKCILAISIIASVSSSSGVSSLPNFDSHSRVFFSKEPLTVF